MYSRINRAWVFPGLMIPLAVGGVVVLAMPDEMRSPPRSAPLEVQSSPAPEASPSVVEQAAALDAPASPVRSLAAPVKVERLHADLRAREGARAKLAALDGLLKRTPEPQAVAALECLLRCPLKARTPEESEAFRLGVVARLGTYRTPRATGRLVALAAAIEGAPELRLAALDALRGQQHGEATRRVLRALAQRDADLRVRERARQVLGAPS